jgi:hypothetical protein
LGEKSTKRAFYFWWQPVNQWPVSFKPMAAIVPGEMENFNGWLLRQTWPAQPGAELQWATKQPWKGGKGGAMADKQKQPWPSKDKLPSPPLGEKSTKRAFYFWWQPVNQWPDAFKPMAAIVPGEMENFNCWLLRQTWPAQPGAELQGATKQPWKGGKGSAMAGEKRSQSKPFFSKKAK